MGIFSKNPQISFPVNMSPKVTFSVTCSVCLVVLVPVK